MQYAVLRPIIPGSARVQRKLGFDYMGKKTPSHDLENPYKLGYERSAGKPVK